MVYRVKESAASVAQRIHPTIPPLSQPMAHYVSGIWMSSSVTRSRPLSQSHHS
jgi:hypothetical protein